MSFVRPSLLRSPRSRTPRAIAIAGLLTAAGLAACTPGDEGTPEPGLSVELSPGASTAPSTITPALRGIRDVQVAATGATWAELTWTSNPDSDGFGVWVAYSEPATLLAQSGMPGEEHWPNPSTDSIEWAVLGEESQFVGSIFVHAVRGGTCNFPVAARPPGEVVSCRAEDLPPNVPVVFFVRPFRLAGSGTPPG
jgi:hypothetical protein